MSFRFVLAGAAALLASACAGWPGAGSEAATTACGETLKTSAAYAWQHSINREEKLKVIRFASQEAMDAYNATTRSYADQGSELLETLFLLDPEFDLLQGAPVALSDHTTDEEADARIAAAKACAAPLTE